MSTSTDSTLATVGELALTSADLLRFLARRSLLRPLVQEALAEMITCTAAREIGLTATDAELQRAANHLRKQKGLHQATQTQRWLAENGLTQENFEDLLERQLLTEKFQQHLADVKMQAHFQEQLARFAQARLSLLVVAAEGLAREVLAQLEEGAEFADLARQHSQHPSAAQGGQVGFVFRTDLPPGGEVVFSARPGSVAGPVLAEQSWWLFQVHEVKEPALDERTKKRVREEIFSSWLQEKLTAAHHSLAQLD